MGSFGTEPQQVVVSWFFILITRSCMHDMYMCVVALAEDLKARALKSGIQTKAPGNTPRAKARPTQDGQRGLQRQRERDGGWRANRFRQKIRGFFISWNKATLKKSSQDFTTCVLTLYCCTSRHHCRRPPWEKRKIRDMTTVDPNPTQTLIGMLWGDECFLDAVDCEGSRLIRPMWLLCVERL